MPLSYIRDVRPCIRLGIWNMTEHPDSFTDLYDKASIQFRSEARRLEYVCVRQLLSEMTGIVNPKIMHNDNGRPLLDNGHNISISHTRGYCSVIVSDIHDVAIDIEYMSSRVDKIASKFMRADETADCTLSRLLCWSAKETVYKLFSDYRLAYEEMRVMPFSVNDKGVFKVENIRNGYIVDVYYEVTSEYVMTYAFLKNL